MSVKEQIDSIVRGYADAFMSYDADEIAEFWLFPSLVNVADKCATYADPDQFKGNLAPLLDFYKKQGVVQVKKQLLEAIITIPSCAFVTTFDQLFDKDDKIITSWNHYYVMRKTGDGTWKIAASIADEEIEAWADNGTPLGS